MRLSVWAPDARHVSVVLGPPNSERRQERLGPAGGGWWSCDVGPPSASPLDYAYRVDGEGPWPDPRSAWQPYGVHGPSRALDVADLPFTDAGWSGPCSGAGILGAVFYELHTGTFTPEGTLDAAIERLDHLVDLGVDVVELMPVAAFPGRWGWGYDGVHPYAVHDGYGGPYALARFVDAAHARGLGVCLDVVYNHLGPVGNYLSRFGPYFTSRHPTPWGPAVNLDGPGSREVRAWVIDNALRWLRDFHVDALRLDAVHELRDDSPRHLLAELSDEVAALAARLGRPLALVAESDLNDPVMVTPTAAGGLGMSAQWDDDVHHALHAALTGERQGYYADFAFPGVLAKTLTEVFLHDGRYCSFRRQRWGAPVDRERVDGRRFVAYLQTHDQVGNRALGDRISASLTPGQQAIGAALYLLSAFTPMVFMGEEWAASTPWLFFTDFDPSEPVARAVREGRRAEFAAHGWDAADIPDPQDRRTRDASVLDWGEASTGGHDRMLRWYRSLVALRRAQPVLRDGRLDLVAVEEGDSPRRAEGGARNRRGTGAAGKDAERGAATGWLILRRGEVVVAVNFGAEPVRVPLAGAERAEVLLAWSGDPSGVLVDAQVCLNGHDAVVLRSPVNPAEATRRGGNNRRGRA